MLKCQFQCTPLFFPKWRVHKSIPKPSQHCIFGAPYHCDLPKVTLGNLSELDIFNEPCRILGAHLGWTLNTPTNFSECQNWTGATARLENQFFQTRPKTAARPPDCKKTHWSCILEGHLLKNSILSALHLQGPKSNIHVHFHRINEQLTGVPGFRVQGD